MSAPLPIASTYWIYGLCISSDLPIPELEAVAYPSGTPDIRIRFRRPARRGRSRPEWFFRSATAAGESGLSCARVPEGCLVRVHGLADFLVAADAADVSCVATRLERDSPDLRHLMLDLVLPIVLKLRRLDAIHATAVLTPHGVCAFVAPAGTGKSTLAAAFQHAGFPALSDDCLVLIPGPIVHAVPGYPGVRLRDDAFAALTANAEGITYAVAGYSRKRRWVTPLGLEHFANRQLPLTRLYRLALGAPPQARARRRLEPLSRRDAFMELVGAAFRVDVTDRQELTREFTMLESIARTVPMRRLWLDDDLLSTSARDAVLADAAGNLHRPERSASA